ncbi:MAG: adenylosuccinate synthase [Armatimonadota bacterium]|nr:adenylosuccinate synthase [Armatimonadota bacterium]MDR7438764.1 adenylosuccinate synthase [Armatimonadota bacterium]MDR7561980.1 adenylosuccinate synthase [Armatimonadota bacterium]MDR7566927.1 adenylosuccinate synthase [Armatimonadota bacterium]MDR7602581.1 adenylosuccinate synthase [Armatimonadota bacterium]
MPVTAVVGLHWGDEGKGKVIDLLAQQAQLVIRFNGGANAGHTIVNEWGVFRLHLIPSGIFNPGCRNLIGPGCVVNPEVLLREMEDLRGRSLLRGELLLSDRAHLTLPFHVQMDVAEDEARAHGTTRQGIWPTYADKVARIGLRAGDLLYPEFCERQLGVLLARRNALLQALYGQAPVDAEVLRGRLRGWAERLRPHIVDGFEVVQEALERDASILLEGHLGAMRDLDWGEYPYVTSSTTLAGGACAGAGIPPHRITRVVGVVKAYTTAVGSGPLPTEERGEVGERLRELGGEYGATTGRPRRCGWFDGVAARFATRLNGCTELSLMKLDVLDAFDRIRICVAYEFDGKLLETVPPTPVLERVRPVYEELAGWRTSTSGVARFSDLPPQARAFVRRIQEVCGVPVTLIGTGARREHTIHTPGGVL